MLDSATPVPTRQNTAGSADRPGVLFIVNSLGFGGAEKHVVTLLNALDKGRLRLSLAYLKRSEQLLPQLQTAGLERLVCCDAGSGLEMKCLRRLVDLIVASDVRVIVCTNMYSTIYGYLARLMSRRPIKLVVVNHTTILRTRKEKLLMFLCRQIYKRCDLLLYVCEQQRVYWRARGVRARQDGVIHNGIDVAHFTDRYTQEQKLELRKRAGFSESDYVIGLCALLRPEKAHGDLLEALARLRAGGLPAKGLFIGDGAERGAIERKIQQLGLGEHVHITGLQPDVRPWIACTDVMALVSHAIETFSLAALESMALAKPLVMTEIGGAAEQVVPGETGFLYPPGEIGSLVQHLTVLSSAPLRSKMSAAAAARVRELYTVDRMSAAFSNAFARLSAPSPATALTGA